MTRSWPMTAAARMPWPMTSPMIRPVLPSGSVSTSSQSPPTSLSLLAGREAAGQLKSRHGGQRFDETALQGEGCFAAAGVQACVVDVQSGPGHQLVDEH